MQAVNEEEMKRLEEAFKQIVARNLGERKSSRWSSVMILTLLTLLIVAGVGYYLYKNKYKKNKNQEPAKEKSKEVEKAPSPVPEGVKSEPKKVIINEQ